MGGKMSLINGIGGVFLFTNNVKRLVEWYRDCLCMVPEGTDSACKSFYTTFEYRDFENPEIKRTIAWAIMPMEQDITDQPRTGRFNYSVKNMAEILAHLQSKGVTIDKAEDYEGFGKLTWITDPDGNKIELWEPILERIENP
jgi:predicted enzyme related to lactoylglutathione lyase